MSRIVRVLPDEPAVDKEFDYLLSDAVVAASPDVPIRIGTLVRIDLRGRRVKGWITALDVLPPDGVTLSEVKKVSSVGPSTRGLILPCEYLFTHFFTSQIQFRTQRFNHALLVRDKVLVPNDQRTRLPD